jgi:glycolate oxidase iron-sulfur subunit
VTWVTDRPPTGQSDCVQCGLCLPVCPTFRLTGREDFSPRGRLSAILAVDEGFAQVGEELDEILSTCLGCRACEPACPSSVPYGDILERARAEIVAQTSSTQSSVGQFVTGKLIPNPRAMRLATAAAALVQRFRLTGVLPKNLRSSFNGMRLLSFGHNAIPKTEDDADTGHLGTVAFLKGCVMNAWFVDVHIATVEVLKAAGYRVTVPEDQGCCGALAAHEGNSRDARRLAQKNHHMPNDADFVVANAAGCSAHLRTYDEWLDDGDTFSAKVRDATQLVAQAIESGDLPRLPITTTRVGVQDPCHHRHAQGIISEPRTILEAAGFDVVEIDTSGTCCGAAGMYSLQQPKLSRELGEAKARQVDMADVSIVASANPGCEMQLRTFCSPETEIRHPIELYWDALSSGTT